VRDGVLSAIESIMMLDADFWFEFADPDAPRRIAAGELRPDWTKRGFLRACNDHRYTFGRYFAPLAPNRPHSVDELFAHNDVVLYDRQEDPAQMRNLAADPAHRGLVEPLQRHAGAVDRCGDRHRHARLGHRTPTPAGLAHLARRHRTDRPRSPAALTAPHTAPPTIPAAPAAADTSLHSGAGELGEAISWFRRAADAGDAGALHGLAKCPMDTGNPCVVEEALTHYRRAAASAGSIRVTTAAPQGRGGRAALREGGRRGTP
jgi:hypothetical protein